ncbi:MAG: hypothetical protein JSU68_07520 [Phycisphaerales bacterium]|nr:MAG: hypothetical protein JSU68_07520 [Phycisphaerales bacterium]
MNSPSYSIPLSDSPEQRARSVSILGLVLQALLTGFLLVVGLWNNSLAVQAEVRFALAGIGVWFLLVMVSHQRKLVRAEIIETADLKKQRQAAGAGGEAIFEVDEEQLMLARRRLNLMLRWLVPIFTFLLAGYYFAAAFLYWPLPFTEPLDSERWPALANLSVSAAFLLGAAFVTFLLSRYASGMAQREEWSEIRAGASQLFGNALLCVVLAVMLGLAHFEYPTAERVCAQIIRALLVLLGVELLLNLLLDVYRPRTPGEVSRLPLDSRFLALFSESGGIARSIAEAINYQFGFEVSSTWFYQLMYRATVPLLAFGALCVVVVSSFVVVQPHELAVVEHFGRKLQTTDALAPGIHFKWPWPIERVYKFSVRQPNQFVLGSAEQPDTEREPEEVSTVLWTTENHGAAPDNYVLVATTPRETRVLSDLDGEATEQSVPVSILRAMAPVQYRIRDLHRWGYQFSDPEELLRGLAARELIRYSASADVDAIMGAERTKAAQVLKERLQQRADEMGLGVDIIFVGLQDFHPHKEVAESFQQVVGAMQQREASIAGARSRAIELLAEVVGDSEMAFRLAEAIREANALKRTEPADSETLAAAIERRDRLFAQASGEVSRIMAEARAYRWQRENEWLSRAERFTNELLAYRAAPSVYSYRKYLAALGEGLENVRKFLVAADTEGRNLILILDQEEEETFQGFTGR